MLDSTHKVKLVIDNSQAARRGVDDSFQKQKFCDFPFATQSLSIRNTTTNVHILGLYGNAYSRSAGGSLDRPRYVLAIRPPYGK